jgi:hypothetical protein
MEKVENVVVDQGVNTDAIRAAYQKVGSNVLTVDEFLSGVKPMTAPVAQKNGPDPFNPDSERVKPKRQIAQGTAKAESVKAE